MSGRVIAIGDIHGCSAALTSLLNSIVPQPDDTIITLGDYIDRGPDSRGVIDRLLDLSNHCQFIPLLGNHEELLLNSLREAAHMSRWLINGGPDTLRSYGWKAGTGQRRLAAWIPEAHQTFFQQCRPYYETPTHIFLHAGYVRELPLATQPPLALRWRVTDATTAVPHCSGKVVVVGHTPQSSGEILDLGFLICIDTNCVRGGWLTALEVTTGQIWQCDRNGKSRSF